jgi:hypothetical protein
MLARPPVAHHVARIRTRVVEGAPASYRARPYRLRVAHPSAGGRGDGHGRLVREPANRIRLREGPSAMLGLLKKR